MVAASIFKGGSDILFTGRLTAAVGTSLISFTSSPPIALFTAPPSHSSSRLTINNVNPIQSNRRSFLRFCTVGESSAAADSAASSAASSTQSPTAPSPGFDPKEAAGLLDIRVGRILKAWKHPEADSLYVEEVDVGEPEPRTICSGLVNYIPLDHLQDKLVVVLANLKPRNMRGVKSFGMLVAASDEAHENVELLVPPQGSVPGERIWFGSEEDKDKQSDAASANQIQKKKIWESVQPHLKTDASCVVVLGEHPMWTSAGTVLSTSLKHANVS